MFSFVVTVVIQLQVVNIWRISAKVPMNVTDDPHVVRTVCATTNVLRTH
jgi:hypothetical protein